MKRSEDPDLGIIYLMNYEDAQEVLRRHNQELMSTTGVVAVRVRRLTAGIIGYALIAYCKHSPDRLPPLLQLHGKSGSGLISVLSEPVRILQMEDAIRRKTTNSKIILAVLQHSPQPLSVIVTLIPTEDPNETPMKSDTDLVTHAEAVFVEICDKPASRLTVVEKVSAEATSIHLLQIAWLPFVLNLNLYDDMDSKNLTHSA